MRPFVVAAAERLEALLQTHDGKGDWMDLGPWDRWMLLSEEIVELHAELHVDGPEDHGRIQAEALDVALCALFIWGASGGCPDFGHRGQFTQDQAGEQAPKPRQATAVYLPE